MDADLLQLILLNEDDDQPTDQPTNRPADRQPADQPGGARRSPSTSLRMRKQAGFGLEGRTDGREDPSGFILIAPVRSSVCLDFEVPRGLVVGKSYVRIASVSTEPQVAGDCRFEDLSFRISIFSFITLELVKMAGVTYVNVILFLLCAAGVGASYYSFFVENNVEKNEKYQAMCDINDQISCTKVFSSKYAKGFGVVGKYLGEKHILNQPNSVYGIIIYAFLGLLSLVNASFLVGIQIFLVLLSNGLSIYLGYLLVYVIKSICVVCVGTYLINFLLLVFTIVKFRRLSKKPGKKGQKGDSKQKKAAKKNK